MIGGFMGVGTPRRIIDALVASGRRGLTLIANDTAMPGRGIGKLISAKAVRRLIVSHIGLNPETQKQMNDGTLEVELVPQGTLVECIRAGGMGLGAVVTPTGLGTGLEDGKRLLEIDGQMFLLEMPIRAEFAFIAARQSDYLGNLDYSLTAQNFNPIMAMAADTVIAEPEHIVPVGVIPPDSVRTPAVLVDHLIERPV
ncbi:acetate CoA/acetoacetate CoA-transferase alpha subunit [Yoonia sediminilitoris]|uniref:Acetate CoA/acetoacetate CoA-transferase alpha subunit n=2 Tax=Yoonia sediminilitoris TaxID=1286148 RepID=A0A2T6K6X3_9RHOB|nr:acetate CoA/acetoacetate CoA-transferase alpha subunit [Yoonia sediminilitoris]RCW89883.1 acetate CoA/acetoacetate CoA-transferase alpha subunit [Yoonia sediminilitoris]